MIGCIAGSVIVLFAVIAILQKLGFLRSRLGSRWKELINAEEKGAENSPLRRPGNLPTGASTGRGEALTSDPLRIPGQVEGGLPNDEDPHPPVSKNGIVGVHVAAIPPPVYTPGVRLNLQSPISPQIIVPTRPSTPLDVGGMPRRWV